MEYYAHSREDLPQTEWQPLDEHLENVAGYAERFAGKIGAAAWGRILGVLHDLGKYRTEFQERIRGKGNRIDHSVTGALWILNEGKTNKAYAKLLAYCIAGHHTGLPNGSSGTDDTCLESRLKDKTITSTIPEGIDIPDPETPRFVQTAMERKKTPYGFSAMFFTRFLFSCLKDADCLDTERFIDKEKFIHRGDYPNLPELKSKFDEYTSNNFPKNPTSKINKLRSDIHNECSEASRLTPGLFSLTVPTGGGKTLSSMAFALEHACRYGFERVIYVIPYTSIIEQTACVFKDIFGEDNVIEHHCNYAPQRNEDDYRDVTELRRLLATENWDAPIIVTTNVQFFESLFHNKTSRVRKIHNIARSVTIFDEAQMLPVPLLLPTLESIRELVNYYNVSCVLCTATQPSLKSSDLVGGLSDVREIVKQPENLENAFKRVETEYIGSVKETELIEKVNSHSQVLCIVNTRNNARSLYSLLDGDEDCYHLSALMCPAHRTRVLEKIKSRLHTHRPCRVISTQLIEAGVDIDFPVVYRAVAGLDSIVQSAGRCNREGGIPEGGRVYVYMPETGIPRGVFKQPAQITETIVDQFPTNFLNGTVIKQYFKELFWIKSLAKSLDEKRILEDCKTGEAKLDLPFKDIASKYRIIEDIMEPIIIPYDQTARTLIAKLRSEGPSGTTLRGLQRYTVGVYPYQFAFLKSEGFLEEIHEIYHIINDLRYKDAYSEKLGLNPDCKEFCNPESLCV